MKSLSAVVLTGFCLLPNFLHAASPVADAGSDIAISDADGDESVTVVLDASATTDSDGDIVSYAWTWSGGSASGETTEGTFPAVDAPVIVTLTVTDAASNVSVDTLAVTAYRKETALFTNFEGRLGNFVNGTVAGETLVIESGFFHDGVYRRVGGTWVYDPIPDFEKTSRVVDATTFFTGAVEMSEGGGPYSVFRFDGSNWIESPITAPSPVIPKADPVNDFQDLQYAFDPQTVVVSDRYNNQYGAFAGRLFVYDWIGNDLIFKTELTPPGGASVGGNWGNKIALEGDLIVATNENSSGNGTDLEIFRNVAGTWTHEATVISDHPSGRGFADFELSIGNGRILVGGTDADSLVIVEKIGPSWVQTDIVSSTFGIPNFFGYKMNDDGESFIADDEAKNLILFEKDALSTDWSTATITETRLLASDLTFGSALSVTGFNNNLAVASDRTLGIVRIFDINTYQAGINVEPIAEAGADITTTSFDGEGVRVFLNGGLSGDLNADDVLNAVWTWSGGSVSGLQAFATLDPTVTSVTLTITDSAGGISRDSISVDIESPPVISSMPDVSVVDADIDGTIRLQINGSVDLQDNPIVAWNWTWPGGTFSGQSGVITLGPSANGKTITLEVIDSNGLVSKSQFVFNLLKSDPVPDFILPIDGVSDDRFASSVAISEGTAIINASDKQTGSNFTGATYLSENINNVWQQIRLANGEATGSAVVIDGDHAFIGASAYNDGTADNVGAVRIYENQSGVWNEVQLLEIPETVTPFYGDYRFGSSLAKSGDWLVVGCSGDNEAAGRAGSVFIYENVGGSWVFSQKLLPPAPFNVGFTGFGTTAAIQGGTLIVGSQPTSGNKNDGAVFVYERGASSWDYLQTLTSDGFDTSGTPGTVLDNFGGAIALSDTDILVGASSEPNDVGNEFSRGVVYRYTKSGATWSFLERILPVIDTEFGSGNFGSSLFLRGDHLLVGEPQYIIQDGSIRGRGQAYVFRYQAGNWSLVDRISVTNEIDPTIVTSGQAPNFGVSLAHDGSDLIVGSSNGRDSNNLRTGKAYIFQDYAALNPDANYEPIADAGADISAPDSIVRDGVTDEITEPFGSEEVTLDGSSSSDQENAIVSWEWNWGTSSASGEMVNARFPVGITTVTLTVTDDQGIVNSDTVDITVTLPQVVPDALPSTAGNTFTVNLPVPAARWRLSSEFLWHGSGETVSGIVADETYQVEVIGYPGSTEVITTLAAPLAGNSVADFSLILPIPANKTGKLIFPETEAGFSWRLRGENVWRNVADNGDEIEDLIETVLPIGDYLLEFRPLAGYVTPASKVITIRENLVLGLNWSDYGLISNYNSSRTFEKVINPDLEGDPYQYVGMIRTPLGRGTGTVVADAVVLSAAHLFFDPQGLNWANSQWFPRQQQGERQAPPVSPRGILYRTSYAKLIAPDSVPGTVENLPENIQESDFAVLYFDAATWTGGSANFLQSTPEKNWLTGNENKHAVGYPQRSQIYPERGMLFEKTFSTPLGALDSTGRLYDTTELFGDAGASGSALFVEPAGTGKRYPAAILLAGQQRAVYRAIDLDVTRMIKDAADTAAGFGDILDSSSSLVTFEALGGFTTLSVSIGPSEVQSTARYSITPNYGAGFGNIASDQVVPFNPEWDSFTITFSAVSGYATPEPIEVSSSLITPAGNNGFTSTYEPLSGYDFWKQDNGIADDMDDADRDGMKALLEYALDTEPDVLDFRKPIRVVLDPSQNTFAEFDVYVSGQADAILYEVQTANSLDDFETGTGVLTIATFTKADGSSDYIRVTDTVSMGEVAYRFARVVVSHDRSLSTGP